MAKLLLNSGADMTLAGGKDLIEKTSAIGDPKMIEILLQHSHTEGRRMSDSEEAAGEEDELLHPLLEHRPPASRSSLGSYCCSTGLAFSKNGEHGSRNHKLDFLSWTTTDGESI